MNNRIIIIGASSGIGKALACLLADLDYQVGLMARRYDELQHLQQSLKVL